MHRTTIHIHAEAPPKPREGDACNGCGVCCAAEPCPVGMVLSRRRRGPCVALVWVDDERRYRCGMVSAPERHVGMRWATPLVAMVARRMIAAGRGCDCSLSVEPA